MEIKVFIRTQDDLRILVSVAPCAVLPIGPLSHLPTSARLRFMLRIGCIVVRVFAASFQAFHIFILIQS